MSTEVVIVIFFVFNLSLLKIIHLSINFELKKEEFIHFFYFFVTLKYLLAKKTVKF